MEKVKKFSIISLGIAGIAIVALMSFKMSGGCNFIFPLNYIVDPKIRASGITHAFYCDCAVRLMRIEPYCDLGHGL